LSLSDEALRNRAVWTKANADYTDAAAARAWAKEAFDWGMWDAAEADVQAFGDVAGLAVIELGCGTAYVSAWLARQGARPVGVDVTPAQLATARRMQEETGLEFPLLEADAVDVPLPDASFDLAVSEYGASIWCDPYRWIPEAARLLRPGGRLIFLCNSPLSIICSPDEGKVDERLHRPQFGMHRFEFEGDDEGIEYHLAHGDWIRLLRETGFEVEALHELQATEAARDHAYYDFVTADWARQWPSEDLWVARKRT
jgi:SAM-dependent methyltransferase